MRAVLDADEVAVAAGFAERLDAGDDAAVGGVDRHAGRGEEVDAVVQVAGARAAEVAAAADDALDRGRELAAAGQREGAEQPPGAGALEDHGGGEAALGPRRRSAWPIARVAVAAEALRAPVRLQAARRSP